MKHPSTLRRELARLVGMRRRDDLTHEQTQYLDRAIRVLRWALEPGTVQVPWRRPSQTVPGLRCRGGSVR